MIKKLVRQRFCRRCEELFTATGKWVVICEKCRIKPTRKIGLTGETDLRSIIQQAK